MRVFSTAGYFFDVVVDVAVPARLWPAAVVELTQDRGQGYNHHRTIVRIMLPLA
jgi:hypothetical protein